MIVWMSQLARDLRHACRAIVRMPSLAAVVVLSLGAGIGVNTAVFSWIQLVVFQPLPGVRSSGSLLSIEPRAETGSYPGSSWLEYRDLRERLRAIADPIAFRMVPLNLGESGRTERSYGLVVSDNYFSALGLRPAFGRFLRPDEVVRPGGEAVAVISHDYWRTRLGADSAVIGRTLRVNDRVVTIVGVAPPGFQGTVLGLTFDIWVPATLATELFAGSRELETRDLRGYAVMGRLASGVARADAQAELDGVMRDLATLYPETNARMQAELRPFWQAPRGPQMMLSRALFVLQAIMLLLLLTVCGNAANLMLARASTRHREVGIRLTLGAGPARVAGMLLTENLVLGAAGAALGALIAIWGTDALRAVPFTGMFPIRFQTRIDGVGLAFAMLLGVGSGLLVGIAPAAQLAFVDPLTALRSGARAVSRSRMRNALMAVQVALALLVLVAAGFFFRSVRETRDIDPGFRRDGVLLAAYDLSGLNTTDAAPADFARRLLDRLRRVPGVEFAAIASLVPLDIHGMPLRAFVLEGRTRSEAAPDQALSNTVTPDYFDVMGIARTAGPGFAPLGDRKAPPQAVVNEEFVRRFLDRAEPIGRRLQTRGRDYVIAGVVRNSLYESFSEPPTPMIYLSYRDRPSTSGEIHVRTRTGAEGPLASDIRRAVRDIDPALPLYNVRTMGEHVEKNLFLRRIPARMFVVLGPLLLALAAIGIYAVVAYAVSQRTAEIGVRLALGARHGRVIAQIVSESMVVIGIGALFGWIIALMVDLHLVRGGAKDIPILAGVPAILLIVATIASWLPARRATRVDPMIALRHD